jgi:hypothetical protein
MKKVLLFLTAAAFAISCNRLAENEFEIAGKIDKSLDGKTVILEKQGGLMGFVPVDTVKVENGKFLFKGTVTDPSLHFVQVEGLQGKVELILENGEIDLDVDKDSIYKTVQGGTYNNDKLHEYYTDINKIRKKMMAFQKQNEAAMRAAYQSNDTVVMNKLNKTYVALGEDMQKTSKDFLKNNPKAFISILLIKQMAAMGRTPAEELKKSYDALDSDLKKTKDGKELGEMIAKANGAMPATPAAPQPTEEKKTPGVK